MLVQKRLKWLSNRPRMFAIAGILGLALLGTFISIKGLQHSNAAKEVQSAKPSDSFSVQADPKPLSKVAENSPTKGATSPASNSTSTTESPSLSKNSDNKPVVPGMKPEDAATKCVALIDQSKQEYNREVQKEKSSLDKTLSIDFGLGISSQYVANYNREVTDIFKEYAESAEDHNCVWPIKAPPLLVSTYSH